MPKKPASINLTEMETNHLQSIVQKGTVEARVYRRAKILLLKADGMSNESIADKLDITVPTVRLCLKKYKKSGIQSALEDLPGRGCKAEIFDDAKAWVVNIACQKPTAFGFSAELWHPASLTKYINSMAEAEGFPRMATASTSSIRKILREAQLNPHKITYYCEKRDPDFDKKCKMYLSYTSSWNCALTNMVNLCLSQREKRLSIRCHMTKSPESRQSA